MSEARQLKEAVETQHCCTATLAQSVPVKETFGGKTVWEGIVHVFKINGHPKANQALSNGIAKASASTGGGDHAVWDGPRWHRDP
jgi:hypothetical protein